MIKIMTTDEFRKLLPRICGRDTSSDPNGWTTGNILWGHSAVVALVAQDLFSGELLWTSFEGTKFVSLRSHYWNQLPDDNRIDFTQSQFAGRYPKKMMPLLLARVSVLIHSQTAKRYATLMERLAKELQRQRQEEP